MGQPEFLLRLIKKIIGVFPKIFSPRFRGRYRFLKFDIFRINFFFKFYQILKFINVLLSIVSISTKV